MQHCMLTMLTPAHHAHTSWQHEQGEQYKDYSLTAYLLVPCNGNRNTYEVHPVFYINLLYPVATDTLEGHRQEPPPLILIDGKEEWFVESILDSQKIRGSLNYLVKWIGSDNPIWQPAADVANSQKLVLEFHKRFPAKLY